MNTEIAETLVSKLVATGVTGLDDILGGGFTPSRVYLIEGNPGSGKTTLALQYLREGARLGEKGIYVTLSETRQELLAVAEVARLVARRLRDPGTGRPGGGA